MSILEDVKYKYKLIHKTRGYMELPEEVKNVLKAYDKTGDLTDGQTAVVETFLLSKKVKYWELVK